MSYKSDTHYPYKVCCSRVFGQFYKWASKYKDQESHMRAFVVPQSLCPFDEMVSRESSLFLPEKQ